MAVMLFLREAVCSEHRFKYTLFVYSLVGFKILYWMMGSEGCSPFLVLHRPDTDIISEAALLLCFAEEDNPRTFTQMS